MNILDRLQQLARHVYKASEERVVGTFCHGKSKAKLKFAMYFAMAKRWQDRSGIQLIAV